MCIVKHHELNSLLYEECIKFKPLTTCMLYWWEGRHRRRIKTEEKAKVVNAVWSTELITFFVSFLMG